MNIADTSNYTIRVNQDIYYIKNKTLGNISYSLYRKDKVLTLINTVSLSSLIESTILFDGDGTYEVHIEGDIVEIKYYLSLQRSLITSIGDFLCDCCNYTTLNNCDCSTPIDVKCVQFSAVPMMLLSYQHLTELYLDNCCSVQYLHDIAKEYEYDIRQSYLGHIQEECIKGKSLYGSRGLRYFAAFYYALFLETELKLRDSEDAEFIYYKFDYERISDCMETLNINYSELKDSIEENTTETCYGGGGGGVIPLYPPVANAGIDQVVTVGSTVNISGSGSYDVDGTIVSYFWKILNSPTVAIITNPNASSTTITGLSVDGTYTLELKVTDNDGYTDTDIMVITVGSIIPTVNNIILYNNRTDGCDTQYIFSEEDFIYTPSNYTLDKVKITSIDGIVSGSLEYNGNPVVVPLEIDIANIGLLIYIPDEITVTQYSDFFTFSIKVLENANYSNSALLFVINTLCSEDIALLQLTTDLNANIPCGSNYIITSVVEGNTGVKQFKIKNTGTLPLTGTMSISGSDAAKFSLNTYVVSVIPGGTQTVTISVTSNSSDGGHTLSTNININTNSDANPVCVLSPYINILEVSSPPITQNVSISIPRDATCEDIFIFSSLDFPYLDGSPVGRTHIRIDTIPSEGTLRYSSSIVGIDLGLPLIIPEASIINLTYTPNGSNTNTYSNSFSIMSSNNNGLTWG